jgi:hypothetical protein
MAEGLKRSLFCITHTLSMEEVPSGYPNNASSGVNN